MPLAIVSAFDNQSVASLMMFAYSIDPHQIVGRARLGPP